MIRNRSQRDEVAGQRDEVSAWLEAEPSELNRLSLQSQLNDMDRELQRFDEMEANHRVEFDSIEELLESLVAVRSILGLTQADLADELGCAEQQIQRWERDDYQRITAYRLFDVEDALGIRVAGTVHIKGRPRSAGPAVGGPAASRDRRSVKR